jgi:hypothetical protein
MRYNENHGANAKYINKSVGFDADTQKRLCINGLGKYLDLTFNHGVEGSSPSALTKENVVQPGSRGETNGK